MELRGGCEISSFICEGNGHRNSRHLRHPGLAVTAQTSPAADFPHPYPNLTPKVADESYVVGEAGGLAPVAAYLHIPEIVSIAKQAGQG